MEKSFQERRNFLNTALMAGIGVVVSDSLFSCKETVDIMINRNAPLKLIMDGNDPMLFTYQETSDNNIFEFYGLRDLNGLPTAIQQVAVVDSKERKKASYINFNEKNELESVLIYNGVLFEFKLVSPGRTALTITTPDGDFQLNTLYSPNGRIGVEETIRTSNSPRQNVPIKIKDITPIIHPVSEKKGAKISSGRIEINVTKCGFPGYGDVYVSIYTKDPEQKFLTKVKASRTGKDGVYIADIPQLNIPKPISGDIFSAVASTLDTVCDVVEFLQLPPQISVQYGTMFCAALSSTLTLTVPATAPFLPQIFVGCEVLTTSILAICSSNLVQIVNKGLNAKISETEKVVDFVTKKLNETTKEILVFPEVYGIPKNIIGKYKVFPLNNPIGALSLELSNETFIRKMILNPPSPSNGQSYDVNMEIDCLPSGSSIDVSVVGTDGFSKRDKYSVVQSLPSKTFSIKVPGAKGGVRDKISLTVTIPGGKTVKREASLVFV
jgi:hypothetical protein